MRQEIVGLRANLLGLQAGVKFRRFMLACKFDPDQPRDDRGRWAEQDGDDEDSDAALTSVAIRVGRAKERECYEQLKQDHFQCAMVGLRSCYRQAAERFAACLSNRPIPPFNY